jgi:hypothetical protein
LREINLNNIKHLFFLSTLFILAACEPGTSIPTITDLPKVESTPTMAWQVSACQSISLEPTPDAKETSLFPPVSEKDYVKGLNDAPMTIIEYGDFQ